MNIHFSVHRIFLISMFSFCAVAVVILVKNASAEGADSNNIVSAVNPENVCLYSSGTKLSIAPTGKLCKTGNMSEISETSTGWGWKCSGFGNEIIAYCTVLRQEQIVAVKPANTVSDTARTVSDTNIETSTNAQAAQNSTPIAKNDSDTNTGNTAHTKPRATSAVGAKTPNVSSERSGEKRYVTDEKTVKPAQAIGEETKTPQVGASTSNQQQSTDQIDRAQEISNPLQDKEIKKSEVVTAPIVIEAKNLTQNNNPKITGNIENSLKVEKVVLSKKNDGKNNVVFFGKAEPGAVVTIYIFSNDPIVITVKADADGNWNYELEKELVDGQHEAYVAVTDNAGKVVSKSEPIAFVKTAQAATMIPVSELVANQSPIEKSSQQYVLIAIIIMVVFLAIALVLIGFLTHKRNLDEGIN